MATIRDVIDEGDCRHCRKSHCTVLPSHTIIYLTQSVIFGRRAVTFRAAERRDNVYARGEMSDTVMFRNFT